MDGMFNHSGFLGLRVFPGHGKFSISKTRKVAGKLK
jgi:hypothetical protein